MELARARTELAAAAAPLLPAVQRALCVSPPETAALPKALDEAPQPALRLAPAGAQLGSTQGSADPGNPSETSDQALPLTAGLPGFGAPPRPALITGTGPAGLGPPPLLGSVLPAARAAGLPDSDAGGSAPGGGQVDPGAEGEAGGAAAAVPLLLGGQAGGAQRGAQWGAWRASRVRILHVRLKSRTLALVGRLTSVLQNLLAQFTTPLPADLCARYDQDGDMLAVRVPSCLTMRLLSKGSIYL